MSLTRQSAPRLSIYACYMSRSHDDDDAVAEAPSYEQVIIGTNIMEPPRRLQSEFKITSLLDSSSLDQGHRINSDLSVATNHADQIALITPTKSNRTGKILALLGVILIPLCGMIILLQIKHCATERDQLSDQLQHSLEQSVNKINDSYSDCNDDLAALQANLDSNEILIRDLRYQVERLTKQRDIFKRMVDDGSSKAKASADD